MNMFLYTVIGLLTVLSVSETALAQGGDLWLMKGHDSRRTGQSLSNGPRTIDNDRTWERTAPGGFVLNVGASVDDNGAYIGSWGLLRNDSLNRDRRFWDKSDGKIYGYAHSGDPLWGDGILDLDLVPRCYEYEGRVKDGNDLLWCGAFNPYHVSFYNGTVEGQAAIDTSRALMYVGRGDGKVNAIDRERGEIIWRFVTYNPELPDDPDGGGEVVTSPLIGNDGTVYVATWAEGTHETNAIYAINPDGSLRWRWPSDSSLPHRFFASPALSPDGSTLYYATFLADSIEENRPGIVYAFHVDGGSEVSDDARLKWSMSVSPEGNSVYTNTLSVGLDGTVYCGGAVVDQGGNVPVVFAIDDAAGGVEPELKWDRSFLQFDDGANFVLGIALREREGITERLYVTTANFGTALSNPSRQGMLYAVGLEEGTILASYDPSDDIPMAEGGMNSPAIGADGVIYVGVRGRYKGLFVPELVNGHYLGIEYDSDQRTFSTLWNYEVSGYVEWSHPAIGPDGGLYVGSSIGSTADSIYGVVHAPGVIPPGTSPSLYRIIGSTSTVSDHREVHEPVGEVFPNPFVDRTTIRLSLLDRAFVHIELHDMLGRRVRDVVKKVLEPGESLITIDSQTLLDGVYFCTVNVGDVSYRLKLIKGEN